MNNLWNNDHVTKFVDDLIVTSGIAEASVKLVRQMKAEIVECFLIVDLPNLGCRARLINLEQKVFTLCEFESE